MTRYVPRGVQITKHSMNSITLHDHRKSPMLVILVQIINTT